MEFYATICRLCEATDKLDGKWADLFATEHDQLLRRIQSLTSIEIHQNDRLPKRICGQCQTSLEQAYNFKLQCEITNKKLLHEIDFLEKNDWNTKLPIPPVDFGGFPPREEVKQETSPGKRDIVEEPLSIKSELSDDEQHQQQTDDLGDADFCVSKVEAMFASGDDYDDRDGSAGSRSSSESSSDSSTSSTDDDDDDSEDSEPKLKRKRGRPRLSNKSSGKPRSSVCDTCGQQFAKPKLMYAHVRSAHGDRRFKCGFCPKTFVRNARLKEHERQHTGERDFQCDQCERKYPTARGLKVHMEDIHSENLPYVCDKCGKGFAKEGKLRQHYSAHLDIRKYVCSVCSKGFKTRTNLNLHVQIHLPPDQRKMRKRENQHKVCICPFCGKVSTSLGTHNMHIRTHTGEQRYECQICQKRFTSSGSHQKHMRVHSGEKPFVCEFCQKSFRQKHHLTTHMRGVHKNENPEAYVRPGICGRPRGVAAKTPGTAAVVVPGTPDVVPPPVPVEDGLGNFEPKEVDRRDGPGEGGKAYVLPEDQQNRASDAEMEYGMNIVVSDTISLDRTIRDTRLEECKHWDYPYDLPTTSVIVVFHNEGFSVLMRTVHSVLNRSPKHVLKEIILVDDYSDKEDLKEKLENYIERFDGKVKLIRNTEREGLIRTRSRGAKEASGEVIVYLDAHCEVNTNWLPPLLAPIYRDSTVMTVPVIDGIDHKSFEYRPVYADGHHYRGIFEWGMLYKENEVPRREAKRRKHDSEPYKSPTHAGGLFAINREFFLKIGAYDPGLLVWGGENFELSFKIWQCGGSIEWVPCSRVGHVYRGFMPYNFGKLANKKKGPLITINYKRVIETWFDEQYKEYFYTREPLARFLDMGDISEQLALKERLQCKSFQWYMDNVAYDVLDKYPALPANLFWGELKNSGTEKCVDALGRQPPAIIGLQHCHGQGHNQLIRLNAAGQLGVGERCIEADNQGIKLAFCRLGTVDGPWQYDETTSTLLHRTYKMCMGYHPQTRALALMPCDVHNAYQSWKFHTITPRW